MATRKRTNNNLQSIHCSISGSCHVNLVHKLHVQTKLTTVYRITENATVRPSKFYPKRTSVILYHVLQVSSKANHFAKKKCTVIIYLSQDKPYHRSSNYPSYFVYTHAVQIFCPKCP